MSVNRSLRNRPLALWLTLGVGVFVLAGSLGLLALFNQRVAREESTEFEALAHANAAFLERTPLPHSDKMAAQLGEVMGARVLFVRGDVQVGRPGDSGEPGLARVAADGSVHVLPNGLLAVGHVLKRGSSVFFVRRPAESSGRFLPVLLTRRDTWAALGVFWLLSCLLAWWLSSRVTRPLRQLASAVPSVGGDKPLPGLPVDRNDEIGLLARTLSEAHQSLQEERERRRAAERLALLGRMATGLAHEVRNPVAAIRLHAQLLDGAPPEEAADSIRLIESEAGRIESLVSQWMSYARPAPPVMSEVDAAEVVRQALHALEPQALHAGVSLRTIGAEEPRLIRADRVRLKQVLMNVLLNAIQAMPKGGMVMLSMRARDGMLEIAVEDEGAGFSEDALARLGEPFFSEKEGGMGLGLAVSCELCRAHGGRLAAGNRPAGGGCVLISLPSAAVTATATPATHATATHPAH